ncbi:MAG TPA: tetratricopeptide repeat protein [Kribbellaceae bacterium]|nr:tetratricopeptide repeat protein [Kribbellaceae bacterium]
MGVAAFLGRVLSPDGAAIGTCFQVAPGVLVTAWQAIAEAGQGSVGAAVLVGPLAPTPDRAVPGRVLRLDPVHDLAVIEATEGALTGITEGFALTDDQPLSTPVWVAGAAGGLRFVEATGRLEGSSTRDGVVVGRLESKAVTAGMRGAPVLRRADGLVVGIVSGRYAGADSWLRDSVWLARVEDLLPLLRGTADPLIRREAGVVAVDVTLAVQEDSVIVSGRGRQAVTDLSAGVPSELAPSVGVTRPVRHTSRELGPDTRLDGDADAVGGRLTKMFLGGPAGALFGELVGIARAAHSPARIALRIPVRLAPLPWEAMRSPGSGLPIGVDPQLRVFRQVPSAPAALPGPLRILVAISSPLFGGGEVLNYERELRNVLTAVRGARAHRADVRVLHFATTSAIRAALAEYPVHVLHVSAHGQPGLLVIEDDDGSARPVSADTLLDEAVPLGRVPPVVALAACHTAARVDDRGESFAARLLARGVSVVIAAETSISDAYAIRLFARIYGRLAADPVADAVAAVADARAEVQVELERSLDDRDRYLAALQEWSAVLVHAPTGSMPVVDATTPATALPERPAGRGILNRPVGEVVGRRREQRQWSSELLDDRTAGIVIHGLGGVGKTTLADELIQRVLEREPDRITVTVTGAVSDEQLMADIVEQTLDQLHAGTGGPPEPVMRTLSRLADADRELVERVNALRELLAAVPILLVLDNFEDNLTGDASGTGTRSVEAALQELLTSFASRPGKGRLLITCRDRFTLPQHAHRALIFHHLGPLSFAETLKLAWNLPVLDRLSGDELEKVWRSVGGHPRCLEYVDALLAGGSARYVDVTLRLAEDVERRLRAAGTVAAATQPDIDAYLSAHSTLDTAIAEAVAFTADEVLLGDLLDSVDQVPRARQLITGAAVYRVPVDRLALAYQADYVDVGHVDIPGLDRALQACVDGALLTRSVGPDGLPRFSVHRWTAGALARRALETGQAAHLTSAHLRAAAYWRSRWKTPAGSVADLREAHYHLVAAARLHPNSDGRDLADVCDELRDALGRLGRRYEAAALSTEHVDLRRRVYAIDTTQQRATELAAALDNHGIHLAAVGKHDEALVPTAEAVQLYRRLATTDPTVFQPSLAGALNNLGVRLSSVERRADALAATAEAVDIRRRLAAADPVRYEPDLAMSLNNLGADLSALHRQDDALAVTVQAVEMYRRLAVADPARFEPDLAMSLNNLGIRMSALGRPAESLRVTADAVERYRRLAEVLPAIHEPHLATTLSNLSQLLANLGRPEQSLVAASRTVEIYRRLAAADPVAFEASLVVALRQVAADLALLGRSAEALALVAEASEVDGRRTATGDIFQHPSPWRVR